MSGVTVGFSAAATSGLVSGVGSAAPTGEIEAGGTDLFAALLALLGEAPTPDGGLPIPASTTTPASPGLTFNMARAVPMLDASVDPLLEAATTEEGNALLKSLGDALIALDDALDAGRPPDPALEKKLKEAVDAIAVYLGITPPPQPTAHPAIAALASGSGLLPPAGEAPAEAPVPAPAAAGAVEPDHPRSESSGSKIQGAGPEIEAGTVPAPPAEFPPPLAEPDDATPAHSAKADPAAPSAPAPSSSPASAVASAADDVVAPADSNEAPVPVPEPLRKLAALVGDLAKRIERQSPELAAKLEELADHLLSGKLPSKIAFALEGDGDAGEAQLQRIIEALSAPRPATAAAPVPQPFITPALKMPEPLGKTEQLASAAATEPTKAPEADTTPRPAATSAVDRPAPTQERAEPESRPAAAQSAAKADPAPTADPATAPTQITTAPAAGAARAVHAAYQAPVQALNLPQVAFEVVRQFEAGNTRFQIRLDPPELGRIDVKLDVDKSGTVHARMTVERPETLDLMQRDQRALQQALQQAGLDSARTNLEFSLRQNPFAQQQGMGEGGDQQPSFGGNGGPAGEEATETSPQPMLYRGTASAGGVNLFV